MNDERETEIVAGTVGAIIQKGEDKWQVEVTPAGSQYAKKLWTKSQATQAQFAALIGHEVSVVCSVSHWAKQDGTPVKSLWIESVGGSLANPPAQVTATPTPPPAGPQQAPQRLTDPTRDSIEKQVALKAAVEFIGDGVGSGPGDVTTVAQVFFDWLQSRIVPENPPDPNPGPVDIDGESIPF